MQANTDSRSKDTLHQSCKTLKYYKFIKINLTGDLSLLKKSGDPTPDEFKNAWNNILIEYSQLIMTEKTNTVAALWLKIEQTRYRIKLVVAFLEFFGAGLWDEEIALELVNHGYYYIEYNEDPKQFNKQLVLLENESKTNLILLNQYITEYNIMCPPDSEDNKRDEMDYEKDLAVLNKEGYKVDKKKNTVFEYAAAVNAFLDDQKRKAKQLQRTGNLK